MNLPKKQNAMEVVGLNDLIVWYADADVNHPGEMGYVTEVSGEAVMCSTFNKAGGIRPRPSVRHKDDPKLRMNDEIRKDGCWDFHPLYRRVRELESLVEEMVAPEKPKTRGAAK